MVTLGGNHVNQAEGGSAYPEASSTESMFALAAARLGTAASTRVGRASARPT